MFALNKFFVISLIASLAFVSGKNETLAVADIEKSVLETNPTKMAVLTQLKSTKSDSGDAIFSYKCTVGSYVSSRLACDVLSDSTSWSTPHDVELKLRCPKYGSGYTLSYVEIYYSVSSPNVNCRVNEGGVGLSYIGMTINAWNTLLFSYTARFYTY